MVRLVVTAVSLVFVFGMTALTAIDFANNGVTPLGVVGVLVLIVVGVGILGALLQGPRR